MKLRLTILIAVLCSASPIAAQWRVMASNLIGTGPYRNSGAMTYSDGVAWAGLYRLYRSVDGGQSWQEVVLPNAGNNNIHGISFYDKHTGAVSSELGCYITHDGGLTWKTYFNGQPVFHTVFSGSPNAFVVGCAVLPTAFTSDDGATWNTHQFDRTAKDFYSVSPGHVIAFIESSTDSHIANTSDYGVTWTQQSGRLECDSHSFGVLDCDEQTIYGINEEGGNYLQDNRSAEIYRSKDGGASFSSISQYGLAGLSGCILITPGALLVPAAASGVLESTDGGTSWSSIGGPTVPIDSRDIIAIDDSTLLAADIDGTIWRTVRPELKGNGSSSYSEVQVLTRVAVDTIAPCLRTPGEVYLYTVSCGNRHATLDSVSITGSAAFSIAGSEAIGRQLGMIDSIPIFYSSTSRGADSAELHLSYTLGGVRVDTSILLTNSGYAIYQGATYPDGTLHAAANSTVTVPISILLPKSSLIESRSVRSVTLQVAYSPSVLYLPTVGLSSRIAPPAGWDVINTSVGNGVLTVTLRNTSNQVVHDSVFLGTVTFGTLPSATTHSLVTTAAFSAMTDSGTIAICFLNEGDYIANVAITASTVTQVSQPDGGLTLNPNPITVGGMLTLSFANLNKEPIRVELLNVLGSVIRTQEYSPSSKTSATFGIPSELSAGVYYLRVASTNMVRTSKLVVVQ